MFQMIFRFFSLPFLATLSCLTGSHASEDEKQSPDEIAEWIAIAEQGNPAAQWLVGYYYANGKGVPRDDVEAVKWYRKAAEQGYVDAQSSLGNCYLNGEGVAKDDAEAFKWYHKAAEQGDAGVQFLLGSYYSTGKGVAKDEVEAVRWWLKAADQGDADAQFSLGYCYTSGNGVAKDEAQGVKWYRKAAEQGDVDSQLILGKCYSYGKGVAKDEAQGVKWYRKAAEQGNAEAQYFLGWCYSYGNGVVKNEVEGYKWSLLGAANGNEAAKAIVPTYEDRLSPNQRFEGQRMAQEWEAQQANRAPAQDDDDRPETAATNSFKVTGTGFFITSNGYLVTNHHVVNDSRKVRVQTVAGLLDAAIVRVDASSDLALLKVTGTFDALPIVSSRTALLGATVATLGFPNIGLQGLAPKVSKGNISSLAGIHDDVRFFQISVPVQPGNSGGALFDDHGNVVGVVSAQLNQKIALERTGALVQNVNYAVKSSYLLGFLEAVPEVGPNFLKAKIKEQKFEAVVGDVKKATVLIVGY